MLRRADETARDAPVQPPGECRTWTQQGAGPGNREGPGGTGAFDGCARVALGYGAGLARSLIVASPYLDAVSDVTTKPFWSVASAGSRAVRPLSLRRSASLAAVAAASVDASPAPPLTNSSAVAAYSARMS